MSTKKLLAWPRPGMLLGTSAYLLSVFDVLGRNPYVWHGKHEMAVAPAAKSLDFQTTWYAARLCYEKRSFTSVRGSIGSAICSCDHLRYLGRRTRYHSRGTADTWGSDSHLAYALLQPRLPHLEKTLTSRRRACGPCLLDMYIIGHVPRAEWHNTGLVGLGFTL